MVSDGPYSGQVNERRMIVCVGATTERTPEGDKSINPGRGGDIAVLVAHETLHLKGDGSYPGLLHPKRGTVEDSWWDPPFSEQARKIFLELDPTRDYSSIYIMRRLMNRGR